MTQETGTRRSRGLKGFMWLALVVPLALSAQTPSGTAPDDSAAAPANESESTPYAPLELTPEQLKNYQFEEKGKESEMKVDDLSLGQMFYMQTQRSDISALMARKLGFLRFHDDMSDLDLIQDIVDKQLIAKDDVRQWQALGVVFGDLLARELDLHWVQVEDDMGVSKALQYKKNKSFVFPVTMLSKRVQFEEKIDLRQIYDRVAKEVEHFRELDRLSGLKRPATEEG